MTVKDADTLKSYFILGNVPSPSNYIDLIDTMFAQSQPGGISYTPAWSSSGTPPSLGNGTILGRYHIHGKLCTVFIHLVPGDTTTFGTGNYNFSLPYTARNASQHYYGHLHLRYTANSNYERVAIILAGDSTISLFTAIDPEGNNLNYWTPISPVTLGNNFTAQIQITYELPDG